LASAACAFDVTMFRLRLRSFEKFRQARPSEENNSATVQQIFVQFYGWECLLQCVEKIQDWLQSFKNIRYFPWRTKHVYDISLNSSWKEKRFH